MTLVEPAEISKLSDVEQQLIRLWRCLPSQAQDKSLFKVARALLDQNPELFHIDIGDEGVDSNERFDWFLHDCVYLAHDEADMIAVWRDYDVAFWEYLGSPLEEVIFTTGEADEENAHELTWAWIDYSHEAGFPLPSEFGDDDDPIDDEEYYMPIFERFLAKWREKVIEEIVDRVSTGRSDRKRAVSRRASEGP